MKTRIFTVLICIAAIFLMAARGSAETVQKSFDVGPGGTLRVDAELGSIEVNTAATKTVDIRMKATGTYAEKVTIDFENNGNNVLVTSEYTGAKNWGQKPKVRFVITVPETYNVDLKTSGGSISVADLDGTARVNTSGGSLTLAHIKNEVWAKTSGGSISLDGCQSDATLDTSGGSIRVGNIRGNLDAETSGGSIHIGMVDKTVNAHTSGGGITLEEAKSTVDLSSSGGSVSAFISGQPGANCRMTTSGGSVNVELAANIRVHLDAQTSGGAVRSDFEVGDGRKTKKSLSGNINGGGPELFLRTSGGSITVNRR